MQLESQLLLHQGMGLAHQLRVFGLAQEVRKVHHQIAAGERVVRSIAGPQDRQASHLLDGHLLHLQREWSVKALPGPQHVQIKILLVLVVVLFGRAQRMNGGQLGSATFIQRGRVAGQLEGVGHRGHVVQGTLHFIYLMQLFNRGS